MNDELRIFRVRQKFEGPQLDDVAGEVERQLSGLNLSERVRPGESVALAAGSRGITRLPEILRSIVGHLQGLGAKPFVVPAMGSHGGATAEGQRGVLASLGVTEESLGCPIRSSMETVVLGRTPEGTPIHFDREAAEADHLVVCNRIKPHTRFAGEIESGLLKMLVIGLGKHVGAATYHRAIEDFGFARVIRGAAVRIFADCRILAGVAIVENAWDRPAVIEAYPPREFVDRERRLLALARQWMPRLPFDSADVLLVDEIGKEISGTGMDANVIGRKFDDHKAVEGEYPKIRLIAVRGLSEATHGNGNGLGMAEMCKTSVLHKLDVQATRLNAMTANHVSAAMIPLDYATDREILDAALGVTCAGVERLPELLWIRNTLDPAELECSEAYWDEARDRDDLEILTDLRPLPFDAAGNLPDSTDLR